MPIAVSFNTCGKLFLSIEKASLEFKRPVFSPTLNTLFFLVKPNFMVLPAVEKRPLKDSALMILYTGFNGEVEING